MLVKLWRQTAQDMEPDRRPQNREYCEALDRCAADLENALDRLATPPAWLVGRRRRRP